MISKTKLTGILLLFIAFMAVSCNDKEHSYDPITLSYDVSGQTFDNQSRLISVQLFGASLPILINGGDGHFSITNNSETIIHYTLDDKTITIYALSPGTGNLEIRDNSHNSYILQITVFSNEVPAAKMFSYAVVRGVDMDASRKADLEQKIVADAPTGGWQFSSTTISTGVPFTARLYLTDAEDSEYKEYTAVLQSGSPQDQTPPLDKVEMWFTMKSDTEEFRLYICHPFLLDNGKLVRGYSLVIEVTNRYITEYPEITHAFEVRSSYNQDN